jgi:hypothetical protein
MLLVAAFVLLVGLSCTLPFESSQDMDSTQVALAIQQTSLLDQSRLDQAEAPTVTPNHLHSQHTRLIPPTLLRWLRRLKSLNLWCLLMIG